MMMSETNADDTYSISMEDGRAPVDRIHVRRPSARRRTVAVIFGGCSPEYGVSLQSAHAVLTHLDTARYEPVPIGITRTGDWFLYRGDFGHIIDDTWHDGDCTPVAVSPDRSSHALLALQPDGTVRRIRIGVAFPVLHGRNGEDGTVQGMFALAGIPIAGCGVLASALCMDKDRAHRIVASAGVAVPRSQVFHAARAAEGADRGTGRIEAWAGEIGYPLFVKPVRAGSSFGVSKVADRNGLNAAVEHAFEYDDDVIVEQAIDGFEIGCAVMGDDAETVGEVDEIELSDGFFDFTEKYTLKTSAIHVPARIDAETTRRAKRTAQTIYRALGCRGFARVDMFLTARGDIVFNEVNTIPGFTSHSRFPNMLKAIGMSFGSIVTTAIESAAV